MALKRTAKEKKKMIVEELVALLLIGMVLSFVGALAWFVSARVIVREGEEAIYFQSGKYVKTLKPGSYWFWKSGHELQRYDTTWQEVRLGVYQVSVRDRAALKFTASVVYRLADIREFYLAASDPHEFLLGAVELAMHQMAANRNLEPMLKGQPPGLVEELHLRVATAAGELGLELGEVIIGDLVVRGEVESQKHRTGSREPGELQPAAGSSLSLVASELQHSRGALGASDTASARLSDIALESER